MACVEEKIRRDSKRRRRTATMEAEAIRLFREMAIQLDGTALAGTARPSLRANTHMPSVSIALAYVVIDAVNVGIGGTTAVPFGHAGRFVPITGEHAFSF